MSSVLSIISIWYLSPLAFMLRVAVVIACEGERGVSDVTVVDIVTGSPVSLSVPDVVMM